MSPGCLLTPDGMAAVAASASCVTSQVQQVTGSSTSLAGSVPVVFIHGIISKPDVCTDDPWPGLHDNPKT